MGFGFSSIEHFFASVAKDLVAGAKYLGKIDKVAGPEVQAISAVLFPQAVAIERGAFALLGLVVGAINDAGGAVGDKGLNITLDMQTVQDVRDLIPAIEDFAKQNGLAKPAK